MNRAYLDPEDLQRLEDSALNLRDRLLIGLLFYSGCRVSEALALRPQDVDLGQGTITILHLKERLRMTCPKCGASLARSHRFCPGCGEVVGEALQDRQERRSIRTVPLDSVTLGLLQEYMARGGPLRVQGQAVLFGITRGRARQIVMEMAQRAGLLRVLLNTGREHWVSPHRLRDAFAVQAAKADGTWDGLRMLQEQLGHASLNTTARYRKLAGQELREWYGRVVGNPGVEAKT